MKNLHEKTVYLKYSLGIISVDDLFRYIWDTYGKRISYYISRFVCTDIMKREDLFQEVMIKIFSSLNRYNPVYSMTTWIYTSARNHCVDYMRRNARSPEPDVYVESPDMFDGNPEDKYINEELIRDIEISMDALTLREREIVYLRFFEQRSYGEISKITSINLSTVKALMKKAEHKLALELKGYEKR